MNRLGFRYGPPEPPEIGSGVAAEIQAEANAVMAEESES